MGRPGEDAFACRSLPVHVGVLRPPLQRILPFHRRETRRRRRTTSPGASSSEGSTLISEIARALPAEGGPDLTTAGKRFSRRLAVKRSALREAPAEPPRHHEHQGHQGTPWCHVVLASWWSRDGPGTTECVVRLADRAWSTSDSRGLRCHAGHVWAPLPYGNTPGLFAATDGASRRSRQQPCRSPSPARLLRRQPPVRSPNVQQLPCNGLPDGPLQDLSGQAAQARRECHGSKGIRRRAHRAP